MRALPLAALVTFSLLAASTAASQPFSETRVQLGIVSGVAYNAPVVGSDTMTFTPGSDFTANYDNWTPTGAPSDLEGLTIVLSWTNSQALGSELRVILAVQQGVDDPALIFADVTGDSPIAYRVPSKVIDSVLAHGDPNCSSTSTRCALDTYVFPGASRAVDVQVQLQQTFRLETTATFG